MGPDNRRIFIAALLSMAIVFIWMQIFPTAKPGPRGKGAPVATEEVKAQPAVPAAGATGGAVPPPVIPAAAEETAVLETAEFRAVFSSYGGALKSYVLKDPKFRHEVNGQVTPVDLVRVAPDAPYPFAMAAAPQAGGSVREDEARAPMKLVGQDGRTVTFEGAVGGSRIVKSYSASGRPYQLELRVRMEGSRSGGVELLMGGFVAPDAKKPSFFSGGAFVDFTRPICRAGEKTERFTSEKAEEKLPGAVSWAGLEHFYFVTVALPERPTGECVFRRGPAAGALGAALRIPSDQMGDMALTLYAGPKQQEHLRAVARGLEEAIDYGPVTRYFAFFAVILMKLLHWFQGFAHSWGIAIILLTVTVKVVLLPLTVKSMQSMAEMRKLQPEIEKLRELHKDDKEKLNLAVMKMYQEHKVNPLGGCLPMLLQMPVFFALWGALQTSVELYREPFLWIHDLSIHDPIYVLPLIMGGSMFAMQKLSPQPADSTQAKMLLYFMPVFFTFIMFQLPAGLALYSVVNNLLSIAQQQALMRKMGAGSVSQKGSAK